MVTKDSQKENHPSGENLRLQLPSDQMAEYCRRVVSHLEERKTISQSELLAVGFIARDWYSCQNDIQIYQ